MIGFVDTARFNRLSQEIVAGTFLCSSGASDYSDQNQGQAARKQGVLTFNRPCIIDNQRWVENERSGALAYLVPIALSFSVNKALTPFSVLPEVKDDKQGKIQSKSTGRSWNSKNVASNPLFSPDLFQQRHRS